MRPLFDPSTFGARNRSPMRSCTFNKERPKTDSLRPPHRVAPWAAVPILQAVNVPDAYASTSLVILK